ncbi:hypothetical protein F5X68DRAFT_196409 [Plectosphaerella plurivora]|uniref:Transcription factor domain-containing protein n=1 Tax=Plectosphaerella plurivora TaxID=936078 RepID=A0A9P9AGU3_9PEZI|nr:hypothetical protein F5X68DRAFT_196409 [Plectosphaerella plurivora]
MPAIGRLSTDYFASPEVIQMLLADFSEHIYSVYPLVDSGSRQLLAQAAKSPLTLDQLDPSLYRRCLVICALTASCIPGRSPQYCRAQSTGNRGLVDQACDLLQLSRLSTCPLYQDEPTIDTIIDSALLGLASHFTARPSRGWNLFNESLVAMKAMDLFTPQGYASLSPMDAEICKRLFCHHYILYVYDRLLRPLPSTTALFPPPHIDWDFFMPSLMPDQELLRLGSGGGQSRSTSRTESQSPGAPSPSVDWLDTASPGVPGFVALLKIFLAARHFLPLLALKPGRDACRAAHSDYTRELLDMDRETLQAERDTGPFTIARRIVDEMDVALADAVAFLSAHSPRSDPHTAAFERMLHIVTLFLQSSLIEHIVAAEVEELARRGRAQQPNTPEAASPEVTVEVEERLWQYRYSITARMLHVLDQANPAEFLEGNSFFSIAQIRIVGATLLNSEGGMGSTRDRDGVGASYVQRFTDFLGRIDTSAEANYEVWTERR